VNVLLVPAHPGFPGQIPQSRKTIVVVVETDPKGNKLHTAFYNKFLLKLAVLVPKLIFPGPLL